MNEPRVPLRPPSGHESGVAAVEFALVLVFLLLLVAGIVEFGRAFWYYDALTKATRDGARMLSVADRETFDSGTFKSDARNRVVQAANAANVKPPLSTAQVLVTCLDESFATIGCGDGAAAPFNVRVEISGYTIDIGGLVPLLTPAGVALAPQTTMRFMN